MNYLFVSGHQRSGTTLLQLILSGHSQITISPETQVISELIKTYPIDKSIEGKSLQALKDLLLNDKKIADWRVDVEPYYEIVRNYEQATVKEVIGDLLSFWGDSHKPKAAYTGNKKGFYIKPQGEIIRELFPESKLITITRNVFAVTASILKTFPQATLKETVLKWKTHMKNTQTYLMEYPDQVMEVQYESLVNDTEDECRRICHFLGIEFEKTMMTNYLVDHSHKLQSDFIHPNTYRPVSNSQVNQWNNQLTNSQIAEIKKLL